MIRRPPRRAALRPAAGPPGACAIAVVAALLVACTSTSRPGPTRYQTSIAPATYEAYVRGRLAFHLGDYSTSIAVLDDAARQAPDQPDLAVALVEALLAAKQTSRALATATWAQRRFPFNPRVALAMARASRARGDLEAARRAAYRAISIERRLRPAHLLLADIHADRGDPGSELAARRGVVELWPDWWRGHYLLGRALLDGDRLAGAEDHLRLAVDRRPGYLPSRMALAETLVRRGRRGEADDLLRDTFDRRRGSAAAARRIARDTLRDLGAARAVEVLRAIDRDDLTTRARYAIAQLLLEAAAPVDALAVARALRTREPDSSSLAWLEGRCLEAAGRPAQAVTVWLQVASDASAAVRARGRAAIVLAATGSAERGVEVARDLMAAYPDRPDAVAALAHATAYAVGVDAGRAWFDGALTSRPNDRDLSLAAAEFELAWGAPDLAYQRVVPLLGDASDADAANLAGYALAVAGENLDRAGDLLRRARELAPEDPAVLDSWGLWLLRRGDGRRALVALRQAAAELPAQADVALHLGEALLAEGQVQAARAEFARANRLSRVGDEQIRARAQAFLRRGAP